MDKKILLLCIALALIAAAIVIFAVFPVQQEIPAKPPVAESRGAAAKNTFMAVQSGSTATGDVLIELTPSGFSGGTLRVGIAANTHSVDLSPFDLMKITTLVYGSSSIKPASAPQLSGHHSSGEIVFNAGKELNSFKIIITGIPAVDERVFEWK